MSTLTQSTRLVLILLILSQLVLSCGDTSNADTADQETDTAETEITASEASTATKPPAPVATNEIVFSWLNRLNIRDTPSMKGKVVTVVEDKTALKNTGEKSPKSETIVLRGVAYHEPWLKVATPDNKTGWVYGGAVKGSDESKGNAEITDTKFEFPAFGRFDLGQWTKLSSVKSGDEIDIITTTYQRDKQKMVVTSSEVGEFGYWLNHTLSENDHLIKEREFHFGVDPVSMLTETVDDYTVNPPTRYQRKQQLDTHYYQLNARPKMAVGNWTETAVPESKVDTTASSN